MYPKERPGRDRHRPGPDTEEATSMPDQSTPAVRCDKCGVGATGMDEHGYALCDRCAGECRGERSARREHVGLMLRAAIAGARATGLPEAELCDVVATELHGPYVTRLDEDVPRHGGWAEGGE
jgi:hypothetical protein